MNICFDTDECLVRLGYPIKSNIALLKILSQEHKIFVWSGNGWAHALDTVNDFKLNRYICGVLDKYSTFKPDISFDDKEIDLGKLNIVV